LLADPLRLVGTATAKYGDIVRFRLGPQVTHLLNHPDHIAHVLQRRRENYDKQTLSSRHIKRVCGESLLTSNGEFWQRQRKVMQPAFHRDSVAGFAASMGEACEDMLDRWKARKQPGEIDLSTQMTRLTFTIVARALLGADLDLQGSDIAPSMRILLEKTFKRVQQILPFPGWVPTPDNRQFTKALAEVDQIVYEIIECRQQEPEESSKRDLLNMLLKARDPDSGEGLSLKQVRNEIITLLIAGHETTANALTWSLHLLSRHPEIQQSVRDEATSVLSGRNPGLEDVASLGLTTQVIRESMRLYPPIWIIERRAIEADVIGGYSIPAKSSVVISPWTLHRHPEFWDNPDEFRPSRFDGSPTPAYIPFGAGPRFCIGSEFAMLEAKVILSMVLQRYRVKPVPGAPIEPFPGITLPPRHGLPVILEPI
jgi:cytochrome P450